MPQTQRQAKYIMMIPKTDNLGNPLGDLAHAAHYHLYQTLGHDGSYVETGKRGFWQDQKPMDYDHLVTYAADSPEFDSHWKQLGVHIGQAANHWGVFAVKEGHAGPQSWIINNPHYQEGQPAPTAQTQVPPPM